MAPRQPLPNISEDDLIDLAGGATVLLAKGNFADVRMLGISLGSVLAVVVIASVMIRHFFNLHHKGKVVHALPAGAAALFILLGVAMAPKAPEGGGEKVAFAAVKAVIDSRCISCHAAKPTQPGFAAPPAGVVLETSEQIRAQAQRIHQQVVVARVMPLGNLTGISDAERALVGRWFAQGAKTD